jgi:hypothetical protein
MKAIIGMAKVNWRHSQTAYLITGICFVVGNIQYIIELMVNPEGNMTIPVGNYLYLLPVCMGVFVIAHNFPKLMNLGGKRLDFFISGIITYLPIAAGASLMSIVTRCTIDKWMLANSRMAGFLDLYDVFGFMERGAVVAFFQMTSFLLLLSITAHTLTLIQGRWYGWATDTIIIAIIAVFTPIAPLRAALVWFFDMIIFHDFAIVQILSCLLLGAAIYCASIVPIKSKQI